MKNAVNFEFYGRHAEIFPGPAGSPVVYVNSFEDDGTELKEALSEMKTPPHSLVVLSGLDWDSDLSPWFCPALYKKEPPFSGQADAYLELLETEVLPKAEEMIRDQQEMTGPVRRILAGYSLAGLFSIYALYRTDLFESAVSASGSFWFPDFLDFSKSNELVRKPERIYLSVGDREKLSRNALLKTVEERTEELTRDYEARGISVTYELNSGGHFQDETIRLARGICSVVS